MRSLWRFRLMPEAYLPSVHFDERGDWYRLVGRLFWLRRKAHGRRVFDLGDGVSLVLGEGTYQEVE